MDITFVLGGAQLAISYEKLWKILIDKNMNKTALRKAAVSASTFAKHGKNEPISMEFILFLKICRALSCIISDIVEVVEDKE